MAFNMAKIQHRPELFWLVIGFTSSTFKDINDFQLGLKFKTK